MLGHSTVKIAFEGADRRVTTWMAPGLGCAMLQELMEFYDPNQPGKVTANSLILTEQVTGGPPDSSLFQPPPGLVERKPSEITVENLARSFRRAGHSEEKARELAREKAKNSQSATLDSRYEQIKLAQ